MDHAALVRKAWLIRQLEERLLSLYAAGEVKGTVHVCIGQEWTGVAAANAASSGDSMISNHRGHGHFLAWTDNSLGLISEVMGKATGVCGGMGGTQHLFSDGFISNGIQGGMMPVATGWALAKKKLQDGTICIIFIGDGTLGEGNVYESLNIASRWELPLLVVLENNKFSQSTEQAETLSGTVEDRARAFAVKYMKANTWDWQQLLAVFKQATEYVRHEGKPLLLDIDTYRLRPHSTGDEVRDREVLQVYESKDPLNCLLAREPETIRPLIQEIDRRLDKDVDLARRAAPAESQGEERNTTYPVAWQEESWESLRIVDLINRAFKAAMHANPRIVVVGEDIKSPYGGAFKVTKDLSQIHPDRVYNTPVSEAAILGVGSGLALGGYLPIVEIMFGDFLSLCFDQILNHACKFPFLYNRQVEIPLIIRTPMGGKRGYGPTHSQSIEKHFLGIPNLNVLALNIRTSPERIYSALFETINSPTLMIENKILYTRFLHTKRLTGFETLYSDELYPTVRITPAGGNPDVTIFCYGGVLEDVEKAIETVFDEWDIICEVICPASLHPLNIHPVLESVNRTHRLLTVEEGSSFAGLGSEVVCRLMEEGVRLHNVERVSYNSFIPASAELETELLPNVDRIVRRLRDMVDAG